jgi:hypothetical protein
MKRKLFLIFIAMMNLYATCRYSMKDVSIPPEVKTVKVNYFTNTARYINPQAHYDISGEITDYSVSTSGISNQESSSNNLNVTVHIVFRSRLDETKNFEADVTRNFPFSASLSITQAEIQLNEQIVKNLTDEIFNRIFSNW